MEASILWGKTCSISQIPWVIFSHFAVTDNTGDWKWWEILICATILASSIILSIDHPSIIHISIRTIMHHRTSLPSISYKAWYLPSIYTQLLPIHLYLLTSLKPLNLQLIHRNFPILRVQIPRQLLDPQSIGFDFFILDCDNLFDLALFF